jgi:hypothetical protein
LKLLIIPIQIINNFYQFAIELEELPDRCRILVLLEKKRLLTLRQINNFLRQIFWSVSASRILNSSPINTCQKHISIITNFHKISREYTQIHQASRFLFDFDSLVSKNLQIFSEQILTTSSVKWFRRGLSLCRRDNEKVQHSPSPLAPIWRLLQLRRHHLTLHVVSAHWKFGNSLRLKSAILME